ncbi:MAG: hypothetical protein IJE43_15445 [Alphaproteobacteria bacterium]|nr:hypothetical protein [Alphaproteobacteria bacterium]
MRETVRFAVVLAVAVLVAEAFIFVAFLEASFFAFSFFYCFSTVWIAVDKVCSTIFLGASFTFFTAFLAFVTFGAGVLVISSPLIKLSLSLV